MKLTKLQRLLLGFLVIFLITFIGCSGIQNAISPAYIPPEIIEYSGADVPRWPGLYTSINDAEYVMKRMQYIRSLSDVEFSFLTDDLNTHLVNARELRDNIFDPDGPIGLLLPALSGLGIGALMIRRPQDKKEIEQLKNGNKTNVS